MTIRRYNHDSDLEACLRIYREVGWVDEDKHEKASAELFKASRGWVAELHGSAECLAHAMSGSIRYQQNDLPLCIVTGVTTSRIARKQGWAARVTAKLLAEEAAQGQAVAILGIFEQGYYNQLGFGNGSYELFCSLEPCMLEVPVKASMPVRLSKDDWQAMHEARLHRRRLHGGCTIHSPALTMAELLWSDNGFGLGYLDAQGDLSHHFWCSAKGEHGPYRIQWMSYNTREQFLELLALVQSLGDQVHSIKLAEPPGIQLQDYLRQPFRLRELTHQSPHENRMTAAAYWQARILNLEPCIAATQWEAAPIGFNLTLTDPVQNWLPEDSTWRGISGDYTITLGQESSIEPGLTESLPTMRASVNAFSRMWLGVRSATSLSWSDALQAPESLLDVLDHGLTFSAPPRPDWDF